MSGGRQLLARAACGAGVDAMVRRLRQAQLAIVCYHGVRDAGDPWRHWLLLERQVLERQLRWLAANFDVLPIDEALIAHARGERRRRPLAAVTFDDGYRSNATLALPILQTLSIPATIYLTTGHLDSGALLWTTWADIALSAAPAIPSWVKQRFGRDAATVKEALKLVPATEREQVLVQLREELGADDRVQGALAQCAPAFAMLSWDEARSMERTGLVTFGAHTVTHPVVSRLSDEALEAEVGGSIDRLAREMRSPSRTFAYPNGRRIDFDARAVRVATAHGIAAAVTTIEGVNAPGGDPFTLRRVVIGDHDSDDALFRLRASGAWRGGG